MASTLIQPRMRKSRKGDITDLNPQQLIFVEQMLADPKFNPTNAARVAGYANPSQAANKLMKQPIIAATIGKAIRERQLTIRVDAARVILELARIALVDPGELVDEDDNPLPLRQIPEDARRAISGYEAVETTDSEGNVTRKLKHKLWSKPAALELIARHLGMLDERFKVQHELGTDTAQLIGKLLSEVEGKGQVIDAKFIEESTEQP